MKLLIISILFLFYSDAFAAEHKFKKQYSLCHSEKLEMVSSIRLPKGTTGMDRWKFETKKCGKDKECLFIKVFNKKKEVASFKDPFELDDCQCNQASDERTLNCSLSASAFRLDKENKGLLMKFGVSGETGTFKYRLYTLKKKKLKALWKDFYGTGEIMSSDNSNLQVVDRDKNKADEILYTAITNMSSSPEDFKKTDSFKVTYKEYDEKKKKMVNKKPNTIFAVNIKEFSSHKPAYRFHQKLDCDNRKILILERNKKLKMLGNGQFILAQLAHTKKQAKDLKKDLASCRKGLSPEVIELNL